MVSTLARLVRAFFHRSLNHCSRYKCVNKGNCTIQHGKGKMCRLCRYQKCLDTGMSKSAIKTGRYNYKKKTDDILEVKKIAKELSGKDSKVELAAHWNYNLTGMDSPWSDSGSQDSSRDKFVDIPFTSRPKAYSPAPSSELRGPEANSKTDHQNSGSVLCQQTAINLGSNQNKVQDGFNSASGCFSSCNISPDFSPQLTPDSFTSASPPLMTSDMSTPVSPLLPLSSSLSPYYPSLSYSNSNTEKTRVQSCESIPLQSQTPNRFDNSPDSNQQNISSIYSSEGSKSFIHNTQSNARQNETFQEITLLGYDSPFIENLPPDMPSSSKTIPIINTFEMLSIDTGSIAINDMTSVNESSNQESQGSFETESSPSDVSKIDTLYQNQDEVVRTLIEAHQKYVTQYFKDIPKEELEKQQRDHYESCVLRKEIFGHIRRIPDHEYEQLYGATGIDADNRAKRMHDYAKAMEETIQLMVCFALAIPGFSELPTNAKLHLIKFSRQEFALLNLVKYVNLELKVYRGVEDDWQCSLEMENSEYRAILDSVFMFLGKFQALNLTTEESVILNALVIMAPDRGSEVSSEVISAIYNHLVNLLIYVLGKRFDRPMLIFAKLMGLITECRSKVEEMSNGFKDYNLLRYMPISDKPLIQLMYSGIYF